MASYRKKPVVIEALHYDGEWPPVVAWLHDLSGVPEGSLLIPFGSRPAITRDPETRQLLIETLEGVMRADPGDWVICGVKRELYPCKADVFEATYEAVTAGE